MSRSTAQLSLPSGSRTDFIANNVSQSETRPKLRDGSRTTTPFEQLRGIGVAVGVNVAVGSGVGDGDGDGVWVAVGSGVGDAVGVSVAVAVGSGVGDAVGDGV